MSTTTLNRDPRIKAYAALIFAVLIAVVGAAMMTVTSSPTMKGAALLWLPAALQLIAGVWLGPRLGFLAGGIGAYAAGIIAYGGWGLTDIIMNLIAGGVANAMLPAVLFRVLGVQPNLGSRPQFIGRGIGVIVAILVVCVGLAIGLRTLPLGTWAYAPSLAILAIAPLFLRNLNINGRQLMLGVAIAILACAVSAAIGVTGAVVGGQSWSGAFVSVGIGWFFGDTVSAMLGLYMLAALTDRAKYAGLVA